MIRLITDAPEFFSDLGDVIRLFYGDVQVSLNEGDRVFEHRFSGDRADVRAQAAAMAIRHLLDAVLEQSRDQARL